ncbi:MAG: M1 family aminopeptidase [Flavobacteriales bacterium]|nr:M1 family aminopeptidase [Flavobacteriales bacterium]
MLCHLLLLATQLTGQSAAIDSLPLLRTTTPRDFTTHHCHGAHGSHATHGANNAPHTATRAEYDMGPSIARSDSFDVISYRLELDVTDYGGQTLEAKATIEVDILQEQATDLWWDLIDALQVDSIHRNGEPVEFTHAQNELHMEMPEGGWMPQWGNSQTIEIWYGGQPGTDPYWGGFYFASDYIYNLGIGLTSMPPHHGKVWYPCFDTFVERATYRYDVTSAGGRSLHGQGTFLGVDSLGGDTVMRSFELMHPIPTYLSAIAVAAYADWDTSSTGSYGENPIRLTSKPAQLESMKARFEDLPVAIDALEYWWGPQAWQRVGYVITTKGAMEHPTNIAYPMSMLSESNYQNEGLYSHELGHHWWGDQVSPHVHNHMWIKEGFAEYSSHLFEEMLHGREEMVELVKDNQLFVLEQAHIDDGGFWPLSPIPDDHIYGRHSYNKGASVVHNLRNFLGDELFRSACSDVIAIHNGGTFDATSLNEALTEASGVDLTPWFEAHILQPGFSAWVIDSSSTQPSGASAFTTTVHLQQKLRACDNHHNAEPLDLTIWNAAGEREELQIVASGATDVVTVEHNFEPALLALNANGRLNQARMDITYTIDGTSSLQNLPWVDMRIGCDEMAEGDSALMRVEHYWTAPDASAAALAEPYVDAVSNTHFWTIDGIWPEGALFDARLNYVGNDPEDLDFDLYGSSELLAFLAWRPSAAEPWQEFDEYTIQMGNTTNGTGLFKISRLKKGQYCFANGDVSVGLSELNAAGQGPADAASQARAFPSPAASHLELHCGAFDFATGDLTLQVFDARGAAVHSCQLSQPQYRLDVSAWPSGMYRAVWTAGASASTSDEKAATMQVAFAVQ